MADGGNILSPFNPDPTSSAIASLTLDDGSNMYSYADGSTEVYQPDGGYYWQDSAGNWLTQDVNGFKCWGGPAVYQTGSFAQGNIQDTPSAGAICQDGSTWGDWTSSPGAARKQAGQSAVAAKSAAQTQAQTQAQTTQPQAQAQPQLTQCSPPPTSIANPGDPIVNQASDGQGGFTTYYQSGATYYVAADCSWTYTDAYGNWYYGDSTGYYCDSLGNCSSNSSATLISGIPNMYVYIGVAFLVILLLRRR